MKFASLSWRRDLPDPLLSGQSRGEGYRPGGVVAPDDRGVRRSPAASREGATPHRLGYRPDIDGLRAVAVLSVLGYHLQISWVSGGFVGVDVFFVISGYLIGALILQDVRLGVFSLVGFYARRIRRIAPAFAAMIVMVLAAAYFLLLPSEYVRLARSALYATLSVSNIYFNNHTGYFDPPAGGQVLLHTWSLGVEEQFYLIFPLFILLVTRYAPQWLKASIGLLWVGSFVLGAIGAFTAPQSAFYLAPARAWELLLGVWVANQSLAATWGSATRNLVAFLGLAMIGFAVMAYSLETPFPGATALVPCLGTALVIAAGQGGRSFVGRLLSLRPVVFVGLISYSLYLWHWPVILFQRGDAEILTTAGRVQIIVYSVALATLSWQFVEKPFRWRFGTVPNSRIVIRGLLGMGAVAAAALLLVLAHGLPARFSPAARAYAAYLDYGQTHFREGSCFIVAPYTFSNFDRQTCLRPEAGGPNYLLIGDSHAAQLWYGLSELLPGVHILQATTAGCRPVVPQGRPDATSCGLMMDYMFREYLPGTPVDRLLIAARWLPRDLPGLTNVLAWAKSRGIAVTLFGPMVEYDSALPRLLAKGAENDDPGEADRHRINDNAALDGQLLGLAAKYGAAYVSYYKLLCASAGCLTTAPDGAPLEFDTDHLTRQGSLLVIRKLVEAGEIR